MEVSGKRMRESKEVMNECGTCLRKRSLSLTAFGYCSDCNEYLCAGCYQVHRDPAPCNDHKLLTGKQMPKEKLPPFNKCSSHTKEKIQYYCKGHSALACQKCVILHHRMCTDVCDISTVSSDPGNIERYQVMMMKISDLEIVTGNIRQNQIQNADKIESNKKQIRAAIAAFCKSVHEHIQKLKKMMIKEVDQIGKGDIQRIDAVQGECDSVMAKLNAVRLELETNRDPDRAEQLFIAMEKADVMLATFDDKVKTLNTSNEVTTVAFAPQGSLQGILTDVAKLGHLTPLDDENISQTLGACSKPPQSLENVTIETDESINIRTQANKYPCCVTDSSLLDDGSTLALADCNNCCLKLVDLKEKGVISEMRLPQSPWQIARIQPNQLVVTFPMSREIQFLTYKRKLLSLGRRQKVSGRCRGIAHHNNKLYISFNDDGRVEILSMSGSVLETINRRTNRETSFYSPFYITLSVDCSIVYVSDFNHDKVFCLDMNGKWKSTYKHQTLRQPKGMCAAEDGSLIVCGERSDNLHLISSDGSSGRVLVDESFGIKNPICVAYSSVMHSMYVGQIESAVLKVLKLNESVPGTI